MSNACAPAESHASAQGWIAVLAGALGALIASLDISIVNSALPQIQGEIGASGTEGTWISTGYLASEMVMIPLTAWLTRALGMRSLLLGCAVFFTLFSMLCGVSHDLPTMIIGRVGQGFFGGALIPTAQTIVQTRLPARQVPLGMMLFGLTIVLGPLLGPILGGWLTENFCWQWCFFLNMPISAALVILLWVGLPDERARLDDLIRADWLGIVGLTTALSCLTVVLEEGQRERWFESRLIDELTLAIALGLAALLVAQRTAARPVLKLRLLLDLSYASVILLMLVIGMVLYGMLYLLPQFLGLIAGYNAQQAGEVLFISSLPAFLILPAMPLLSRLKLRILVLIGLMMLAASCFLDSHLSPMSSGPDFVCSQLLRGGGQLMAFLPLNQASVGAVAQEDAADAAGLFNMARNLGGSMGLALLGVFIDRQLSTNSATLSASVTANSIRAQARLNAQTAQFVAQSGDFGFAHAQALAAFAREVRKEALVITYGHAFWILGAALLATAPLVLVLKSSQRRQPWAGAH